MKLLYVTNAVSGPGGLERVLSIKASYLVTQYHYNVHIITLNQPSTETFYEFNPNIVQHNITTSGSGITYFLSYLKALKKLIKTINPNMVSVCDDGLKGLLLPVFIKFHCPKIYERHVSKNIAIKVDSPTVLSRLKIGLIFKLMNFGASFYDAFVVLTHGNTKEWPLKNLKVIPNPLSFYPQVQSTLQNKKVLAVGKQSFQKGYDRLLKSWQLVALKHSDWSLDIYGTFDEREGLESLAKTLGIKDSVHFFAPVKNIADKYQQASIYAMSSRYEGFGMVLTEAMSYGVPCVSYNCPYGPSDIIANEVDGFLVANGDISKFSEKIIALIESEPLRHRMGALAKEHVKRFLPDVIVPQWDALFNTLIPLK
ncbi:MAG: glycosyltransferase family 4 protein [Flavobacteriaceae bacterium CG17_big_fil_post_rev_8_21_14_2_50_33_15]|nr:MAG: glycosyltransferase family 4 protein [Flavobacteriaceae bacterium CG17_big_fil_post_rev_8_21_14_2_50_33_15]